MIGVVMSILALIMIGLTILYHLIRIAVRTGIIEALNSRGLSKDKISKILHRGGMRND